MIQTESWLASGYIAPSLVLRTSLDMWIYLQQENEEHLCFLNFTSTGRYHENTQDPRTEFGFLFKNHG